MKQGKTFQTVHQSCSWNQVEKIMRKHKGHFISLHNTQLDLSKLVSSLLSITIIGYPEQVEKELNRKVKHTGSCMFIPVLTSSL